MLGCQSGQQNNSANTGPFDELTKKFASIKLAQVGSDEDVKAYDELSQVLNEIWTKFPERRAEFLRSWLVDANGDRTRKSMLCGKLLAANWTKDFSSEEKPKLEAVIGDALKISHSNVVRDLCQIIQKNRLKSVLPALQSASESMKPGVNKTKVDETIAKLKSP